jgi:hypothetical protein
MTELEKPKAYITIEDTLENHDKLYGIKVEYGVEINAKGEYFRSCRSPPKALLKDLIQRHGAEIDFIQEKRYCGKNKAFDIYGVATQKTSMRGINYIQVRIVADTVPELFQKLSDVKIAIGDLEVEPKVCAWDQLGKITIDKTKPKPKLKPSFDRKFLEGQRTLELETFVRDN